MTARRPLLLAVSATAAAVGLAWAGWEMLRQRPPLARAAALAEGRGHPGGRVFHAGDILPQGTRGRPPPPRPRAPRARACPTRPRPLPSRTGAPGRPAPRARLDRPVVRARGGTEPRRPSR